VGLRNRHHLQYQLHLNRMPPFRDLTNWIRGAFWMAKVEPGQVSLCRAALEAGHDPAFRYGGDPPSYWHHLDPAAAQRTSMADGGVHRALQPTGPRCQLEGACHWRVMR
jgi:hypothetical protein